jgi:uncharacterized protein
MWPYYEAATTVFYLKLFIFWASWLVFPFMVWLISRIIRSRAFQLRRSWPTWLLLLLSVWFIEMRFIEPKLIITRTTPLQLGFQARIALISDYHLGIFKDEQFMERVVETLNSLDVDAVLIAGDQTYEPATPLATLLAPLAKIHHPVFSVPGNHDEQRPGPPLADVLQTTLKQLGVKPIEYTHYSTSKFTVVGIGDHWSGKDGLKPLQEAPKDKPVIVLTHNPDTAMKLSPSSAKLVLAGHTHGGQIRIPILYRKVIPTQYEFDRGLHTFPPVPTFVTSGLGEVGLSMRFLNPPVIDILEIQ